MSERKISMQEMQTQDKTFIKRNRLLSIVPLSDRTIFNMEKSGRFPRRFALSPRAVVWDLREVEEWMNKQQEAGRQCTTPQFKTS
jgi:prophage regulatory protein